MADLRVLAFAEAWLRTHGPMGPHGNMGNIASLGDAIQRAIEQWDQDRHKQADAAWYPDGA